VAKSKPEMVLAADLKKAGIAFEREYACIPGRMFRFDFFLGYDLLIEVQGGIYMRRGAHSRPENIIRDMEKANLACFHGYRLLCFDSDAVYSGSAIRFIQQVLAKLKRAYEEAQPIT